MGTSDPSSPQIADLLHQIKESLQQVNTRLEKLEENSDKIQKHLENLPSASGDKSKAESPDQSPDETEEFVGAVDQGTTSSRFLIFNKQGEPVANHQLEFEQIHPHSG